ncbi:MAG: folate-binding protein YgfZ [Planctomycetota bacterium]
MNALSPFAPAQAYRSGATLDYHGTGMAAHFGNPAEEYRHAREEVVLFDRSDRGLLVATGRDRKAWLHGLVTNIVDGLPDYTGAYAFACNEKGRILFDANILALPDALWLDVDLDLLPDAAAHLSRYIITEQVTLSEASGPHVRCAVSGPRAAEITERLGVADLSELPPLASRKLPAGAGLLFRHDLAGAAGFELILPREFAVRWWDRLADWGARPAGLAVLDALRIEAGLPWSGRDLDETVLPPETGAGVRGLSYAKGCYIGQEVIERMRAHSVLARRLVKVRAESGDGLVLPTALRQSGREAGRLTSLVAHPRNPWWVGLAYIRTNLPHADGLTAGEPARPITIITASAAAVSR